MSNPIFVGARIRPFVAREKDDSRCLRVKGPDLILLDESSHDHRDLQAHHVASHANKHHHGNMAHTHHHGYSNSHNNSHHPIRDPTRFQPKVYTLDAVVDSSSGNGMNSSNAAVYEALGKPMLQNTLDSLNTCLFAYGQTGSGKTTTIMGHTDNDHCYHGENGDGDSGTPSSNESPNGDSPNAHSPNDGLLSRFLKDLFDAKLSNHSESVRIRISMLEIYNEQIHDLLRPLTNTVSKKWILAKPLKIHCHPKLGTYVKDLTVSPVESSRECLALIEYGRTLQTVSYHAMNAKSSRAHTLIFVSVERSTTTIPDEESGLIAQASNGIANLFGGGVTNGGNNNRSNSSVGHVVRNVKKDASDNSKNNSQSTKYDSISSTEIVFADLAGRENEKYNHARGDQLIELSYINKSLFHLANCIAGLTRGPSSDSGSSIGTNLPGTGKHHQTTARDQQKDSFFRSGGGNAVSRGAGDMMTGRDIPKNGVFRNSKLTMLLQNCLSGNCRTYMIATLSPAASNYEENLRTLSFANTVRTITVRCQRQEFVNRHSWKTQLEDEVKNLHQVLEQNGIVLPPVSMPESEFMSQIEIDDDGNNNSSDRALKSWNGNRIGSRIELVGEIIGEIEAIEEAMKRSTTRENEEKEREEHKKQNLDRKTTLEKMGIRSTICLDSENGDDEEHDEEDEHGQDGKDNGDVGKDANDASTDGKAGGKAKRKKSAASSRMRKNLLLPFIENESADPHASGRLLYSFAQFYDDDELANELASGDPLSGKNILHPSGKKPSRGNKTPGKGGNVTVDAEGVSEGMRTPTVADNLPMKDSGGVARVKPGDAGEVLKQVSGTSADQNASVRGPVSNGTSKIGTKDDDDPSSESYKDTATVNSPFNDNAEEKGTSVTSQLYPLQYFVGSDHETLLNTAKEQNEYVKTGSKPESTGDNLIELKGLGITPRLCKISIRHGLVHSGPENDSAMYIQRLDDPNSVVTVNGLPLDVNQQVQLQQDDKVQLGRAFTFRVRLYSVKPRKMSGKNQITWTRGMAKDEKNSRGSMNGNSGSNMNVSDGVIGLVGMSGSGINGADIPKSLQDKRSSEDKRVTDTSFVNADGVRLRLSKASTAHLEQISGGDPGKAVVDVTTFSGKAAAYDGSGTNSANNDATKGINGSKNVVEDDILINHNDESLLTPRVKKGRNNLLPNSRDTKTTGEFLKKVMATLMPKESRDDKQRTILAREYLNDLLTFTGDDARKNEVLLFLYEAMKFQKLVDEANEITKLIRGGSGMGPSDGNTAVATGLGSAKVGGSDPKSTVAGTALNASGTKSTNSPSSASSPKKTAPILVIPSPGGSGKENKNYSRNPNPASPQGVSITPQTSPSSTPNVKASVGSVSSVSTDGSIDLTSSANNSTSPCDKNVGGFDNLRFELDSLHPILSIGYPDSDWIPDLCVRLVRKRSGSDVFLKVRHPIHHLLKDRHHNTDMDNLRGEVDTTTTTTLDNDVVNIDDYEVLALWSIPKFLVRLDLMRDHYHTYLMYGADRYLAELGNPLSTRIDPWLDVVGAHPDVGGNLLKQRMVKDGMGNMMLHKYGMDPSSQEGGTLGRVGIEGNIGIAGVTADNKATIPTNGPSNGTSCQPSAQAFGGVYSNLLSVESGGTGALDLDPDLKTALDNADDADKNTSSYDADKNKGKLSAREIVLMEEIARLKIELARSKKNQAALESLVADGQRRSSLKQNRSCIQKWCCDCAACNSTCASYAPCRTCGSAFTDQCRCCRS